MDWESFFRDVALYDIQQNTRSIAQNTQNINSGLHRVRSAIGRLQHSIENQGERKCRELTEKIQNLLKSGIFDEARSFTEELVKEAPAQSEYRLLLTAICIQQRDFSEASSQMEKAKKLGVDEKAFLTVLTSYCEAIGDRNGAENAQRQLSLSAESERNRKQHRRNLRVKLDQIRKAPLPYGLLRSCITLLLASGFLSLGAWVVIMSIDPNEKFAFFSGVMGVVCLFLGSILLILYRLLERRRIEKLKEKVVREGNPIV